jgi:hypothetical protein
MRVGRPDAKAVPALAILRSRRSTAFAVRFRLIRRQMALEIRDPTEAIASRCGARATMRQRSVSPVRPRASTTAAVLARVHSAECDRTPGWLRSPRGYSWRAARVPNRTGDRLRPRMALAPCRASRSRRLRRALCLPSRALRPLPRPQRRATRRDEFTSRIGSCSCAHARM